MNEFIDRDSDEDKFHWPFTPSPLRSSEKIRFCVIDPTNGKEYQLQVWRFSPVGVELIHDENLPGWPTDRFNIALYFADQRLSYSHLPVQAVRLADQRAGLRVALPRTAPDFTSQVFTSEQKIFTCSEEYPAVCIFQNPVKLNEVVHFRLRRTTGLFFEFLAESSLNFVAVGMTLKLDVLLPTVFEQSCLFKITQIGEVICQDGKDYICLQGEIIHEDTELNRAIGQYIATFCPTTDLSSLHANGLSPSSVKGRVKFSFVRSKEDYNKVLELRYLAYLAEGKVAHHQQINDMGDSFDATSRIIIGKLGERVVASARMTFSNCADDMEMSEYVSNLDKHLPPVEQIVEFSRVCTHPAFRGSDLILYLFQFMAVSGVDSDRTWVLLSATDKMERMYKKMGAHDIGTGEFYFSQLNNSPHRLYLANIRDSILGKGMDPITWNLVYRDVADFFDEKSNRLHMSLRDRVRKCIYSLFSPLSRFLWEVFVIPAKVKKLKLTLAKGHLQ